MATVPQRVSLFKRGGSYSALYYAEDGKRHWRSLAVGTKPEALKRLTEFGALLTGRRQCISLDRFIQDFLRFAEATYRPGTVALYRHTLRRLQSIAGDISLPEVSGEHFDKYRARRLQDKTEVKKNPNRAVSSA